MTSRFSVTYYKVFKVLSRRSEFFPETIYTKSHLGISSDKLFTETMNLFLKSLDRNSRVIFVKRYYFCERVGDIAKEMKLTEGNVSVKLNRMKNKLKKLLIEKGILI